MQQAQLFPMDVDLSAATRPSMVRRAVKKHSKSSLEVIQTSIFDLLNQPLLTIGMQKAKFREDRISEPSKDMREDLPEVVDWPKAMVWNIHRGLFAESIQVLMNEGNADEKLNVLEWIFAPNYIDKLGKVEGKSCIIRRHTSDIPFSFKNCCKAMGVADHETFRELMIANFDAEIRVKLEKYLHITQGL